MSGSAYDFYNPFMTVVIVTADGTRWPLWTNIDQQVAAATYAKAGLDGLTALCFVSEVTVALSLSGLATIKVVLTPPFEEGRKLLDSSVLEWPFSTLEVQLGYVDGPSPGVFTGMMQQPEFQMGTDISITLTAMGEGGFNAAVSPRKDPLPRQSRLAAITSLLKGVGNKRNLPPPDISEIKPGSEASILLKEEVLISPAGYSEWSLIQSLARQCRCWVLFLGKTLKLRPYQELLTDPPKRSFFFRDYPGGKLGVEVNAFPILSVSSDITAQLFFTGVTEGLSQGDIQSSTGKIVRSYTTDATAKPSNPGLGTRSNREREPGEGIDPQTGLFPGQGTNIAPGSPEDPVAKQEAVAEFDHNASRGIGIDLTIETLGVPDLNPGDVIAVYGVGKRFDSTRTGHEGTNYAVHELTHKVGSDGFTSTLKCYSNTAPFATLNTIIQPEASGAIALAPTNPSVSALPVQAGTLPGALDGRNVLPSIEGIGDSIL